MFGNCKGTVHKLKELNSYLYCVKADPVALLHQAFVFRRLTWCDSDSEYERHLRRNQYYDVCVAGVTDSLLVGVVAMSN